MMYNISSYNIIPQIQYKQFTYIVFITSSVSFPRVYYELARNQQTHFRLSLLSSGGREAMTGNASAVHRLIYEPI